MYTHAHAEADADADADADAHPLHAVPLRHRVTRPDARAITTLGNPH